MPIPRIAVINDDPDFLGLIEDLLKDTRNYDVELLQNGTGAVERLHEIQPDAIVLDIRMEYQRMGYDILKTIRNDQHLLDTPVIVCTADTEFLQQFGETIEGLGADWLEKPFEIGDLLGKIDGAVASTRTYEA